MEMETSMMLPKAPRPTVDDSAVASQVLEIIGGITLEALQTLEEPDMWPMEEGDDSVFYSDEDQAHQERKASRGFGADGCEHPADSVAAGGEDPGQESTIDDNTAEVEKEVTEQVSLTAEELQILQPEPMDQSDPGDPAEANPTPEKSVITCGESLCCTIADMQTQQNISAEKASRPVEEEVTPNLDVTNEQSYTRLNGQAAVPEQNSSAELLVSGDRQLQVEPEEGRDSHVPVGFHQNPSPAYSTLPLQKNSCSGGGNHGKSFNHLTASKYSTVSYRKIRRGNTRQKIEEFEYMIMNL